MELWSWTLEAIGLVAVFFVGRKKWWSWLIMILASCLWIAFGLRTRQYGFSAASIVFLAVYSRNLLRWKADQSPAELAPQSGPQPGNPAVDVEKWTSVHP